MLIDHAWGYEPCTMEQVKAYKPETNSVCSGQVLHCPYDYEKAKLIVKEMTDQMVLDLVDKGFVTDQLVLTIGYDIENLSNPNLKYQYKGEVTIDRYGRKVPKHAHGTANLEKKTSSTLMWIDIVNKRSYNFLYMTMLLHILLSPYIIYIIFYIICPQSDSK